MQKLDFNKDGKLVAYTNNGCTDGKSATTEVKGTFEVSADVVNFILAKEYDLPAAIHIQLEKKESVYRYSYEHVYYELKRLQKAIDHFNKSRRFYERKIKNV